MDYWCHPDPLRRYAPDASQRPFVGKTAAQAARARLALCPAHTPTPLVDLPDLASELGIAELRWKDESARLGLTSFKALGGAHAVVCALEDRMHEALGRAPGEDDWHSGLPRSLAADLTIVAATAGNHGLSVAAGARIFGARCVIFVHDNVPEPRRARLRDAGAELVVAGADFDASVLAAEDAAKAPGHILVSDTAYSRGNLTSDRVIQGYGVMGLEIIDTLPQPPTHVFLQAGVGGLAAATAGLLCHHYGPDRPAIIIVEPDRATALLGSLRAGRLVRAPERGLTGMDMLACYQPSALPFDVLHACASAALAIDETDASTACDLARSAPYELSATPSGTAGLAGLIALARDAEARQDLKLDAYSRVVLIGSEGHHRDMRHD